MIEAEEVINLDYHSKGLFVLYRGAAKPDTYGEPDLSANTIPDDDVIKRARTVESLIEYASHMKPMPKVCVSDGCEIIFSLEVTDGKEWWFEPALGDPNQKMYDEDDDMEENCNCRFK